MFLKNLRRLIKHHGGLKKSYLVLLRTDDLKLGECVGIDKLGNKYYENNRYFVPKNRWVIFSDSFGYDYDASYIHPQWFNWIHHISDIQPTEENYPNYSWILPWTGNETGTENQYVPYSTTLPKIIPWKLQPELPEPEEKVVSVKSIDGIFC